MGLSRAVLAIVTSLIFSTVSYAANQASCTFTTFSAAAGYTFAQVNGVSDDGTVVGQLENKNSGALVAFSRDASGHFTVFQAPNSQLTWFNHRNRTGVNVGSYLDNARLAHVHGLAQSGADFVVVNYPKAVHTWLYGINSAGTVVGNFQKGTATNGFKLENGKYSVIRYVGALSTTPQAISDNGRVVGSYFDGALYHGFSWQGGSFTTIDSPNARFGTILTDVNTSGVIVGSRLNGDRAFGFIYKNNKFASIVYSGAKYATAGGINSNGVIAGQIYFSATNTVGYTAVCQ